MTLPPTRFTLRGLRRYALLTLIAFSMETGGIASAQQATPPAARSAAVGSIVDSQEWQDTQRAFQEWLAAQRIYTNQEVQQMVGNLQLRVAGMTEPERVKFLKEMQARLAVLNSQEAQQARAWIGETMSRLTPAAQKQFRQQIPDVVNMSAAEIQQSIANKQLQMQARQRNQAAAARLRAQQNQMAQQMNQQRQAAFQDARTRQQSAVSAQASNRVQQGFEQSQQNARNHSFYAPGAFDPLINPYIWTNPWVW